MQHAVLIRYGELFLKGDNRSFFERLLQNNVRQALKGIQHELYKIPGRLTAENYKREDEESIIDVLSKVFGIHSFSPALKTPSDLDKIKELALSCVHGKSFKVETNRADKKFPMTSMEVSRDVGSFVLSKMPQMQVDLHNPECRVNIDIRENGFAYIYSRIIDGERGMPYGSSGKGLLLLSGGIDSPVAAYKIAKRGMTISALHFHSYPYTSERALQKVKDLAGILCAYTGGTLNLYTAPFTEVQQEINKHCHASYMITIMRRIMMLTANQIAKKEGASAIITGEALGQVASQTIESLTVTNAAAKLPVLRPLIAEDKLDIIGTANKIGTYETSVLPYEDCCTVFLPKNPLIKPKLDLVLREESRLDVDSLVDRVVQGTQLTIIGADK